MTRRLGGCGEEDRINGYMFRCGVLNCVIGGVMTKQSDQWQTPQWLFKQLNDEFHFDVDLCATKENSKCDLFMVDYLNDIIEHKTNKNLYQVLLNDKICFMNPPYSNPKPFIEKAWEDSQYCKIVCLVKCDPSTRWWATSWNYDTRCPFCIYGDVYCKAENKDSIVCNKCHGNFNNYNGPKPGCEVRFYEKRIQFDPPQQLIDSGEVWKLGNKWRQGCYIQGVNLTSGAESAIIKCAFICCKKCKGKGYTTLSGPSFSSALLIFDRRGP